MKLAPVLFGTLVAGYLGFAFFDGRRTMERELERHPDPPAAAVPQKEAPDVKPTPRYAPDEEELLRAVARYRAARDRYDQYRDEIENAAGYNRGRVLMEMTAYQRGTLSPASQAYEQAIGRFVGRRDTQRLFDFARNEGFYEDLPGRY